MDKPEKDQALFRHKLEPKLCLICGFPNRESDKRCLYCKTSILEEPGLISWVRQTYYVLRWRWQLKQRRKKVSGISGSNLPPLNLLGYFLIGAIFIVAGLYLFTSAITENSFSSGLIAVLLLFYGIFTFKSLFIKN